MIYYYTGVIQFIKTIQLNLKNESLKKRSMKKMKNSLKNLHFVEGLSNYRLSSTIRPSFFRFSYHCPGIKKNEFIFRQC